MPKMKSNSGAAKRFKRTASGKLKRKHAFKNHILTKKSKKRKLKLRHFSVVNDADKDRMEAMLPYLK
jgi:large subunit ribosomal protein L35